MKAAALFIAGYLAVFSLQGCQTLSRGKTQPVPATSKPSGVKVLVDGTAVGYTPVNLTLTRKDVHVVRFELAGYRPVEIRMTKKRPPLAETILTSAIWVPVGAVALGIPIYAAWNSIQKPAEDLGDLGQGLISITAGAILGWAIGTVIDSRLPTNYDLAPQTLYVTMEKADDESAPLIIETDPVRLGQLRWIRVGTK